jgi:hypothetical protein
MFDVEYCLILWGGERCQERQLIHRHLAVGGAWKNLKLLVTFQKQRCRKI